MRVLVCGSRTWKDRAAIERELRRVSPSVVIEGEAAGADVLSRGAALDMGIPVAGYIADWKRFGKGAGPRRNQEMLKLRPDRVLAFHENIEASRGTRDTVARARRAGIKTEIFIR